jgi:hypothetical protein
MKYTQNTIIATFLLMFVVSFLNAAPSKEKSNFIMKLQEVSENTAKILVEGKNEDKIFILTTNPAEISFTVPAELSISPEIDIKALKQVKNDAYLLGKSKLEKVELNLHNLNVKTNYFLQVYLIDNAKIQLAQSFPFSTLDKEPEKQASNIAFGNVTENSMLLLWQNGTGEGRIVVAKKDGRPDLPEDGKIYKANEKYGSSDSKLKSSFVIFDGHKAANRCQVKDLKSGKYYFQVFEYNGDGESRNYLTKTNSNNPRDKETALPAPKATDASEISNNGFTANWSASDGAETYILQVATDDKFQDILPEYNSVDIGNITSIEVVELESGKIYFYRVQAATKEGKSRFSNVIKVETK